MGGDINRSNQAGGSAAIARLVGDGKSVLHLGCGTGELADQLRRRGCTVVGVELDPEAAKAAASFCDDIVIGDVDAMDLGLELDGRSFDVVVAGGVLSHVRLPAEMLSSTRQMLSDGGYLVCLVRNAADAATRLSTLRGAPPDGSRGFTRASLTALLADAGFAAIQIATPEEHAAAAITDADVPGEVLAFMLRDPDALAARFVALALPVAHAQTGAIPRLVASLASERDELLRESHRLRVERGRTSDDLERATAAQEDARLKLFEAREQMVRLEEETDRMRSEHARHSAELAHRDRTIAAHETHLDELRHRIDELEREHATALNVLEGIYASKMWRWSELYRKLARALGTRR